MLFHQKECVAYRSEAAALAHGAKIAGLKASDCDPAGKIAFRVEAVRSGEMAIFGEPADVGSWTKGRGPVVIDVLDVLEA